MTSPPDDTTTDTSAVIAALRTERDAALAREAALAEALATRTAELAERKSEFDERIEYQVATGDVLKAMSASPDDAQPVLELIVRRAAELCESRVGLFEFDGSMHHLRAMYGFEPDVVATYSRLFPQPLDLNGSHTYDRAVMERQIIHIRDIRADPVISGTVTTHTLDGSAVVSIPLLRDGLPIGVIGMNGSPPGGNGFSDSQIELLKTFAEEAVIAITSAETYRALQTRTSDLQESLEYQTATSDVLKVISRSTFDLQPVLDTVAQTAARLCEADQAAIYRREGESARLVANFGFPPEYETYTRAFGAFPIDPNAAAVGQRTLVEGRPVHVHDVATVPGYWEIAITLGRQRTSLGVPLLREGETIGNIMLARQRVEPFTDRQIEIVSTFAAQAVIAIENTRLLTEQREALEQQTATAEVLQVINASPGNLVPVFDTMLERAMRLCGGTIGGIFTFDGDHSVTSAVRGVTAAFQEYNDKYPMDKIQPGTVPARIIETRGPVQNPDVTAGENYRAGHAYARALVELGGIRAVLAVPLLKDGVAVGMVAIYRQEAGPFSDKQIALLQNFAAQAVIAIENTRLLTEQQEALEQQTATAEVLQVINANPGNLAPVFDAVLEKSLRLCSAEIGVLLTYDGDLLRLVATRGVPPALVDYLMEPHRPPPGGNMHRIVHGENIVHIDDVKDSDAYRSGDEARRAHVDLGGGRTAVYVALRKDNALLGVIVIYRQEVRAFSDKDIALLKNFAAQAVIAMENARLLDELRERTEALAQRNSEFGERIEQQSATIDVLKVMSSTPDDTQPVFELIVRRAQELCKGVGASLIELEGNLVHFRATHSPASHSNDPAAVEAWKALFPMVPTLEWLSCRAILEKREVHIRDVQTDPGLSDVVRATNSDIRSHLTVPLMRDGQAIGSISLRGKEPGGFTDSQVALLRTFAEQAVIAIGSVANFRALRERTAELAQRQEELRVTFENMGDGVAMFDETQHLVAWNRKFQDILDVPDDIIAQRQTFSEYVRYLAERGEYGPEADPEEHVRGLIERAGQSRTYERTRPDGRVIEIRSNPVADGGFVLIYADITERKRSEAEIRAARDAAEEASRTIEAAYRDLKAAQANLIQAEKMASLGQLTAGIAHEIKNPLNFVNNFAELSVDLLGELKDAIAPAEPALTEKQRAEVEEVSVMLTSNLEKITEHGKRADSIVKAMLEHSRGSSGERRMVDLNALIDEALNLAYHGARAQDQSFNITLERDFGEGISPIEVNPQDITRVFLNLFSNGFYATTKRARSDGDAAFVPTLKVSTSDAGEAVEIRVRDNGTGIPADIRDKLFQPFFTTKPTGEGTGLGLSITYDIVTQQHGGSIAVDSKVGDYSEFTIQLPRNP